VKYAELQIGLHQWGADEFEVDLLYSDSSGPGEQRLSGDAPRLAAFDPVALRQNVIDPRAYGRALSEALFASADVRSFFTAATQSAAALRDPTDPEDRPGCPLQVRLHIGRRVTALHDLRWETLTDPRDDEFLATKESVVFSRYLNSPYYRPLPAQQPGRRLQVVLAVAEPTDSADHHLDRFDAAAEARRARAALDPNTYAIRELVGPGQATLDGLVEAVGEGCDVLYLICHGRLVGGAPWVWLVNPDNKAVRTAGVVLVTRLMELLNQPQLVVLASCQSGGIGAGEPRADDNGALAGLGPRLAEAGIPAVLAMQGNVTVATAGAFLASFFRSLARDSAVDVAAAAARRQQEVRDRADFWMPVLFTRLQSGRIWAPPPGLEAAARDFRPWDGFLNHLEKGEATAVLGFGVLEALVGTREEAAAQWAQRYEYPLSPSYREDLTQVAQYLAVQQGITFPGDELTRQLRREVLCRLSADRRAEAGSQSLNELLRTARPLFQDARGATGGLDPFDVLARLPFRAYVNTTGDNLLEQALAGPVGRTPQVRWFDWQGGDGAADEPVEVDKPPPGKPFAKAAGVGRPPVGRPLIYYLFGHFDDPRSLVLTEDNYIDHLIGLTLNRERLPKSLTSALVDSALLFLGFRFDDWSFRVLFRTILRLQGSDRLRNYTNVAVQIDPERDRIADPGMARRYLTEYFGKSGAQINVYWGSVARFLRELGDRWAKRQA
jgi:hypothetical protein